MPQPLLDAHDAAADVCNGSLTKLDQEILRSIFAELDVILDAPCCVIKHSELLAAATNPSSDLPFISPGQLNALAGGEVAGGSEEAACSLSSVAAVQVRCCTREKGVRDCYPMFGVLGLQLTCE